MAETNKKTCPVCDTVVAADARKCPSCDTDLTLFDIDMDGELDVDKIEISDESAIDDILSSIVGKDESSKLLEDIKSIGEESEVNEIVGEAESEPAKIEKEPGIEEVGAFECPSCGALVGADQTSCPNCGVEFEEEEILEFECPVCNAPVSATATSCDNCGVKFEAAGDEAASEEPEETAEDTASVEAAPELEAETESAPEAELEEIEELEPVREELAPPPPEPKAPTLSDRLLAERQEKLQKTPPESFEGKDLYKVLPALVNDIKPTLAIAKKHGINIGKSKELISQAVAYNKSGDTAQAVEIIQKARITLDNTLTMEIANDIEDFVKEVKDAKAVGCEVAGSEELIREAINALRDEDYEVAVSDLEAAINELQRSAGAYREATLALEEASQLIKDGEALGLDMEEAVELLAEGREAVNRKGWETAALFAKRAKDGIAKTLPDVLMGEMVKAKDSLLDLKMRGGDLKKPMGIYKQASIAMKREEYSEALKSLRAFKKEIGE